jgi:hypothetical protein
MVCKHCGSKNLEMFEAEFSACFPRIEDLRQSPVYVCQGSLICLDCGYVDFKIPAAELDELKRGLYAPRGRNHSGSDSSISSQ